MGASTSGVRARLATIPPAAEPEVFGAHAAGDLVDGRFELVEPLGAGGMGIVWRARDYLLDVDVALKLVHRDQLASGLERLLGEARALAAISHPGVVKVHTFGKSGSEIYLTMELIEGETVESLMEHGGGMPADDAVQIMVLVLDTLEAAHAAGIVHRDVKPNNIMIVEQADGTVLPKLLDFGVSLREGQSRRITVTGQVLGTPYYMAAEQASGAREVDHRADLWSAAVVLYELVAGIGPFDGEDYYTVLRRVLCEDPTPLGTTGGSDDRLWQIIERALRKDREERWASAREMADALRGWLFARGHRLDLLGRLIPAPLVAAEEDEAIAPEPSLPAPSSSGPVSRPIPLAVRAEPAPSVETTAALDDEASHGCVTSSVWLAPPRAQPRRGLKSLLLAAVALGLAGGLVPSILPAEPGPQAITGSIVPAPADEPGSEAPPEPSDEPPFAEPEDHSDRAGGTASPAGVILRQGR